MCVRMYIHTRVYIYLFKHTHTPAACETAIFRRRGQEDYMYICIHSYETKHTHTHQQRAKRQYSVGVDKKTLKEMQRKKKLDKMKAKRQVARQVKIEKDKLEEEERKYVHMLV